jgi:outer membrane protein assembly factor BamB
VTMSTAPVRLRALALTALALAMPLALAPRAAAVSTAYWIEDTTDDFYRGEAEDVAIASDGTLRLAPRRNVLADVEVPYLWDIVPDDAGGVFVGTGDDGWVVHVKDGAAENWFQCAALEVLSVERIGGALWAGTAPEGFVYRIGGKGEGDIVLDAEQHYVWDLEAGPDGKLYAAVGPTAAVYRIDPATRKSEVFAEIEDRHAVCLAFDAKGNLLVGTEGRGLVIRIAPDGTQRVLHDCPQGEVAAVLAAADGTVYAAAAAAAESREQASPDTNGDGSGLDDAPYMFDFTPDNAGDGVLYRIDPEGNATRFWESGQGAIFDLAFASDGDVLVATGDTGALFAVHPDGRASLLFDAQEEQVAALHVHGDQRWIATASPARVMRMEDGLSHEGTYRSRVIDARRLSRWGRLSWIGGENGGHVTFHARRGNTDEPDRTWTDWEKVPDDGALGDASARYLQWRVTMQDGGKRSPEVRQVRVSSLENNIAPIVRDVEVIPAGNRFYDDVPEVRPRPLYQALPGGVKVQYSFDLGGDEELPPEHRAPWAQGVRQVRWTAVDPNSDPLVYELSYRREDETEWKPFAEDVDGKHWTFNSRGVPDGEYRILVKATDRTGNATGALESSGESEPFVVDNTAPEFREVKHQRRENRVNISASVEDASSDIVRLEYSVDGGDWEEGAPGDGVFDSRTERMDVTVDAAKDREHSILLRGTDLAGNLGTTRVLIRP